MTLQRNIDAVLMVRNGAPTLTRLLDSLQGKVDGIIAYLAGESTDETVEILTTYKAHMLQGTWHDNFAEARNAAFAFARNCGTDWAVLVDADDRLELNGNLLDCVERLESHQCVAGYATIVFGSLRYQQKRLFNLVVEGEWRGRVHETYHSEGASEFCPEVAIVHERAKEARDGGRNLRILRRWYEEAPEEFDGHTYYNFANELMWNGSWAEAAAMYERAVSSSVWDDEKYFALIRRGKCLIAVCDWASSWMCFIQAVQLKPTWKDAYLEMSRWFYYQQMWQLSVAMSIEADSKEPASTIMPVDVNNYTVGQAVFDSYTLGKLHRYYEALKVTEDGLKCDPSNQMLLHNLEVYRKLCSAK